MSIVYGILLVALSLLGLLDQALAGRKSQASNVCMSVCMHCHIAARCSDRLGKTIANSTGFWDYALFG